MTDFSRILNHALNFSFWKPDESKIPLFFNVVILRCSGCWMVTGQGWVLERHKDHTARSDQWQDQGHHPCGTRLHRGQCFPIGLIRWKALKIFAREDDKEENLRSRQNLECHLGAAKGKHIIFSSVIFPSAWC